MKIKYSIFSIILSVITLISVVTINHQIAIRYLSATGKTRALFGLTELLSFGYKYYFFIPAVVALLFGGVAIKKRERYMVTAIILGIAAISIVFLRIWLLMI